MTEAVRSTAKLHSRRDRAIVIGIGIFKVLKGSIMILAAVAALALSKPDVSQILGQWVHDFSAGPRRKEIGDWVLMHVFGQQDNVYRAVALGATLYAIMFFTEAFGLFFDRAWAEWMVVVTSCGLIPFEIREIWRRPGALAILVFILNVAIVVYLYLHVRHRMKSHGGFSPSETPPGPPRPDEGSCGPGTSTPRSEASASALR